MLPLNPVVGMDPSQKAIISVVFCPFFSAGPPLGSDVVSNVCPALILLEVFQGFLEIIFSGPFGKSLQFFNNLVLIGIQCLVSHFFQASIL